MKTYEIKDTRDFKGWVYWEPTSKEWLDLYMNDTLPFKLYNNEYLIVHTDDGSTTFYCNENGNIRKFTGQSIETYVNKTPAVKADETFKKDEKKKSGEKQQVQKQKYAKGKKTVITARNNEQVCAIDMLKDRTKPLKLLTGTWGTGKTMLLVTAALEALRNDMFDRIVWIRNNVDVKDTKDLGALPGEVIDKLLPFLGPFIDHAGEHSVRTMIDKGTLVVEPLQSLRGRNFERTLIMCSEAENLTKEHIQLIIARAAEGSEVWMDADSRQRDKAAFDKSKGVETVIEKLYGNKLFGYVNLVVSERSALASLADNI